MLNIKGQISSRYRVRRAVIPKTRNPFINTHLLALGPDGRGRERFWTSSCIYAKGTTCLLLDEDGEYRALSARESSCRLIPAGRRCTLPNTHTFRRNDPFAPKIQELLTRWKIDDGF